MSKGLRFLLFVMVLFAAADTYAGTQPRMPAMRIGLTPVFLDDQAAFLHKWKDYLERKLGRPVIFTQRGNYREILDLLRDEKLDFAWLCGYPYVREKVHLRLVAVPLYRGEP